MRYVFSIALCCLVCGGCASFPKADKFALKNPFSKKEKEPEPYPTPVKMATTWTPDTLSTPGKRPTRGFGGRIFFYNDKSQPVPVEGDLTITAYEESSNPSEPSRVRRFGFTAEQLTKHYSQSDLGASYSIWIPWDVDGGPGERITMVPSFKSAEMNSPIQGSATAVLLPGPMPEQDIVDKARRMASYSNRSTSRVAADSSQNPILQAGYSNQYRQIDGVKKGEGVNTLTIPVNSQFARRISR